MKKLNLSKLPLVIFSVILSTIAKSQSASAAGIVSTFEVESPKVETSQLGQNGDGNSNVQVYTQTFDGTTSTYNSGNQQFDSSGTKANAINNNYQWTANVNGVNTTIGTYDKAYISSPNQYGGAIDPTTGGSNSNYMTVNSSISGVSTTTLTFNQGQRYFGLNWEAGDPNNLLTFQDAQGNVLGVFKSSDVSNAISKLPAAQQAQYKGNPSGTYAGKNSSENYAYLNFFDTDTDHLISKVIFSNSGSSGFENDNNSVATTYNNIRGQSLGTLAVTVPFNFS